MDVYIVEYGNDYEGRGVKWAGTDENIAHEQYNKLVESGWGDEVHLTCWKPNGQVFSVESLDRDDP